MARAFVNKLFGTAAVLLIAALAAAQDSFAEGVKLYRLGKLDEALKKFEEVLAADPSNEQAFELWKNTDLAVWRALMLEQNEIGKVARHLLDLATLGRKERSRDEARIQELVDQATGGGDYAVRRQATIALMADHGEFAVPALVAKLGNADDVNGQRNAILALHNLGRAATLPLLEVLGSDDPLVRQNAVAALGYVKDERAAPALKHLADSDANEVVRETAGRVVATLGVDPAATAVDLYLHAAGDYLTDGGVRDIDRSAVIWSLTDGKLAAQDVPAAVYNFELAKKAAHAAFALDPANETAGVLLARSYLGEATAISESLAANPSNEALAAWSAKIPALRNAAAAGGLEVVRWAAAASRRSGMTPMAVAAIELLGELEDRDTLPSSPLTDALGAEDKRIAYAAALAMTKASGGAAPPTAERVVEVLGTAVREETILTVKVIDQSPVTEKAVREARMSRGVVAWVDASAVKAMNDLYQFPNVDVVVLSEDIGDARPEAIIGLIRKDPRMQQMKILVVSNDPAAIAERYGDRINGTIQGPVSGESLREAINAALAGVQPDVHRARADKIAVAASEALHTLAAGGVAVDAALDSLVAQLGRADAVAVPAAAAIGRGGNVAQLEALLATSGGDAAGLELKVACTDAAGMILGRAGEVPAGAYDGLFAIATNAGAGAGQGQAGRCQQGAAGRGAARRSGPAG